jgi:GT2 family glycosyltransferase
MPTPSLAVAVATRNRPDSLARLIDSLLAQSRRPDEILVIDDGQLPEARLSEWRTRCQSAGVALLYHRKDRPGRSASRNLAARLTECDTVCFLDDDCEPAGPFLERMSAGLASYGRWDAGEPSPASALVAVEGMVVPPGGPRLGDRVYAALLRLAGWWCLARPPRPRKLGENLQARGVLGGVCAVRRDALLAVQFDASLAHGEDREWSVRLSRLGRIARVTDAVCVHHVEPAGRPGPFRTGQRIARNYLHSQRKLFGAGGAFMAVLTLTGLAIGEFATGLAASLLLRKSGPGWLARAAGLIAGMFSPHGPRGE